MVLLLSVLFSSLFINDEYEHYEKQLQYEHQMHIQSQHEQLIQSASQLARLIEHELHYGHKAIEISYIEKIFNPDGEYFFELYDAAYHPLFNQDQSLKLPKHLPLNSVVEYQFHEGKDSWLYLIQLDNGYLFATALYSKPKLDVETEHRKNLKNRLVKLILGISTLTFILFAVMFGINKVVNAIVQHDLRNFLDFLEYATQSDKPAAYQRIFYKEFRTMVYYTNLMLKTIKQQKNSLHQLNTSLEQKVEEKTHALQENNQALQVAQQFSQSLLDSQKQFLRHAIHETNTPLSVIMANIDLYKMKHGENKQLNKIEAAMKNIFNIYDDLSYLIKKDQVEYPKVPINFNAYLESRKHFFEEVAKQSRLNVTFTPCEEEVYIYFNETKLQRIIDNNITNAIKYTLPEQSISISTTCQSNGICFTIASKSKKIEDVHKILEPYYREDGEIEGFGLGLNLVKSICDEEHVTIEIETSEELTRFAYTFKVMGQ